MQFQLQVCWAPLVLGATPQLPLTPHRRSCTPWPRSWRILCRATRPGSPLRLPQRPHALPGHSVHRPGTPRGAGALWVTKPEPHSPKRGRRPRDRQETYSRPGCAGYSAGVHRHQEVQQKDSHPRLAPARPARSTARAHAARGSYQGTWAPGLGGYEMVHGFHPAAHSMVNFVKKSLKYVPFDLQLPPELGLEV